MSAYVRSRVLAALYAGMTMTTRGRGTLGRGGLRAAIGGLHGAQGSASSRAVVARSAARRPLAPRVSATRSLLRRRIAARTGRLTWPRSPPPQQPHRYHEGSRHLAVTPSMSRRNRPRPRTFVTEPSSRSATVAYTMTGSNCLPVVSSPSARTLGDRTVMFERLFGNRTADPAIAERVPPGQYVTTKFPVLHYGSVPKTNLATWDFKVYGEVDSPFTLTWDQFKALPRKTVNTDIHCVTRWSKLDTTWEGVPIQTILEMAQLQARRHARPRPLRAGLHREPAARGPGRRRRPPRRHVRRRATRAGARLPAAAAGPEALLLEERQVDPRPRVPEPRHPRLLGAVRLQQRRRSLEGRALLRVGARPRGEPRRPGSGTAASHSGRDPGLADAHRAGMAGGCGRRQERPGLRPIRRRHSAEWSA